MPSPDIELDPGLLSLISINVQVVPLLVDILIFPREQIAKNVPLVLPAIVFTLRSVIGGLFQLDQVL